LSFDLGSRQQLTAANFGLGLARDSANRSQGLGAAMGARWAASERVSLHMRSAFAGSHSAMRNEAAVEFQPMAATSVALGQAFTSEKALLGTTGSGALAVKGSAGSASFVRLRRELGQGWSVFGHAETGTMQVSGQRALLGLRDIKTSQYGLGLAYQGPEQSFGLALSQPLRADSARADFRLAAGRNVAGDVSYRASTFYLRPSGRQLDLDLSYRMRLSSSASLDALATISRDAGHVAGARDAGLAVTYQQAF
jgi:hypothetical protein